MEDDEYYYKCPVCKDLYTTFKHPIKLDCNYDICIKCLNLLQSNSCPLCRHLFQSLVNDLLPNFEMIKILEKTEKYNCQTLIQEQSNEYQLFLQEQLKIKEELYEYIEQYQVQQLYKER